MKKEKEYRINIRATAQEKEKLSKIATSIGVKQSTIIREAISDKIADLTARINSGQTVKVALVGE